MKLPRRTSLHETSIDHNPRAFFRTATLACVAVAALTASSITATAQNDLPVCPLIATGGTIAMKIDPIKKAPVPAISGEDLVATVPDVSKYAKVEVNNVSNVPSDYMDPPRWIALTGEVNRALARPEVAGVIISHGTDTLEETAYWLDLTTNSEKPIILIGAQRNASEPDFDGPRNLLNAVRICVDPQSKGKSAMLAMNNQINAARDVTKTHTCRASKPSSQGTSASSALSIMIASSFRGLRCSGNMCLSKLTPCHTSRSLPCMVAPTATS